MLTAIIPVKAFHAAKQRLAELLSRSERFELAVAMMHDTLETLTRTPEIGRIVVVTADDLAATIAGGYGVSSVLDTSFDLNGALTLAADFIGRGRHEHLVVLPTDIPAMRADDVSQLFRSHVELVNGITLATARTDLGTNAMVIGPHGVIDFRFGPTSSVKHLQGAQARGVRASAMIIDGLAFDVDTVADLETFLATGRRGRVSDFLANIGAAARVTELLCELESLR